MDYTQFGGTLITPDHPKAHIYLANEPIWNFGRIPTTPAISAAVRLMNGNKTAYELYPGIQGVGEGKTTVLNHFMKHPRVLGSFLQSQYQPRGTCVSRGAKRVVDYCQGMAIYFGYPYKFEYTSHAYIYGTCREYGHDLNYQDGAVGEWAAWAVSHDGNLRNVDVGDDDNLDDLAVKWGAKGVPNEIKLKGRNHLVRKMTPINSYAEARDWIASGIGGVTVASGIGYEGKRDKNGVIRIKGRWSHQMCYTGQREDSIMKALLQDQSWGPDQPGGDIGSVEIANYEWWTLQEDVERQISERDTFGFAWLDLYEELPDVTWRP